MKKKIKEKLLKAKYVAIQEEKIHGLSPNNIISGLKFCNSFPSLMQLHQWKCCPNIFIIISQQYGYDDAQN